MLFCMLELIQMLEKLPSSINDMETFGKKCLLLTMIRGADLFSFCISKNIVSFKIWINLKC